MADFLLIHGSGHGAWCWRDVLELLNNGVHRARAIDLPGHGADKTPINDLTLEHYTDAILAAIDTPVILVGHSLAGVSISAAAQKRPEVISRLVYLTAWAPKDGQSALDIRRASNSDALLSAMVRSPDRLSTSFAPDMLNALFYHDCPPGTLEYAMANLCPEPITPSKSPVHLGANYAAVPRSYIRCMDDRAIAPDYQVEMSQNWPKRDLYNMQCAHSPFFAQPGKLAQILLQIAEDI